MIHQHSIYDTDSHFSINHVTRAIKNESSTKTTLIQHDHNSERFTFEIPRYIEGHDMSLANKVQIHYFNSGGKNETAKYYDVTDLQLSPEADDVVIFSWLISSEATKNVGSLNFVIRFACENDDGVIEYAWHTAVFSGVSVSTGIYNSEAEISAETIIAELKAELEELKKDNAVYGWIGENLVDEGKPKGSVFCNNTEITVIPETFDFSQLENAKYLFYNCVNLKEIKPVFDFSHVSNAYEWMVGCEALEEIRFVSETIGRMEMLSEMAIPSPVLSYESIQSILTGYVENPQTTLIVHSDVMASFTDEQWEIISNKSINIG